MMAEVWLCNQFSRFISTCTKTNVNPVSDMFHNLTKNAVIHTFEETLFKLSVEVNAFLQPSVLVKYDTSMNFGNC